MTKDFHHNLATKVIVPAYNESNVICQVLSRLDYSSYDVVVVDDGSSDNTYSLSLRFPVTALRHSCNLGQGAAIQTGIEYALLFPQTKYIVTYDADGQHCPDDILKLTECLREGNYDVALGSRFAVGGYAKDIRYDKLITLKLATLFTKLITNLEITDTHNGLRAFTSDAARKIKITMNGMAHASEILSQISKLNLKYREVPVTILYTEYSRHKGQSILNSINILWETFVGGLK